MRLDSKTLVVSLAVSLLLNAFLVGAMINHHKDGGFMRSHMFKSGEMRERFDGEKGDFGRIKGDFGQNERSGHMPAPEDRRMGRNDMPPPPFNDCRDPRKGDKDRSVVMGGPVGAIELLPDEYKDKVRSIMDEHRKKVVGRISNVDSVFDEIDKVLTADSFDKEKFKEVTDRLNVPREVDMKSNVSNMFMSIAEALPDEYRIKFFKYLSEDRKKHHQPSENKR